MTTIRLSTVPATIQCGVAAGAAGGLAEILWVSLYAQVTGGNAASLARGVTTATGLNALLPDSPVALGIIIHMVLAVLLGVALAFACRALALRAYAGISRYLFVLLALVGVWTVNFFVVLPLISPAFVDLVPYPVSLMSKLLFGFGAAEILRRSATQTTASDHTAARWSLAVPPLS